MVTATAATGGMIFGPREPWGKQTSDAEAAN
jgi:hypothetical protein